LNDFEVTDGEEEEIFLSESDDVSCDTKEETSKWFQPWSEASSSKNGDGAMKEPDEEDCDSDNLISLKMTVKSHHDE
jgi:hypothetical protein